MEEETWAERMGTVRGGGALYRRTHLIESGKDTNTLHDWFSPQHESIRAHLIESIGEDATEPIHQPLSFFPATY